jgi:hypothetical protein
MIGTGVFGKAALLVLGCIWIKQVLARLRADLREIRDPAEDTAGKAAIVIIWAITVAACFWISGFALSVGRGIMSAW